MIHTLYIEDNPDDVVRVREMLAHGGEGSIEMESCGLLSEGLARLSRGGIDVVLLDLSVPDARDFELVDQVRKQFPALPIVILTGTVIEERRAISAFKQGVQDYLVKDEINGRLLARSIRYARERKLLDQLKEEFVGIASHELRSPIAVIRGTVTNLKDGILGPMTPQQKDSLERVNRSVDRLTRLIDNLLTMTRFESTRVEPHSSKVDIVGFLKEIVEDHEKLIVGNNLQLKTEFSPEIPAVAADSDMMAELMNNLISNALRFAKKEITIRLKGMETKGQSFVQVSVSNDGPFISPEDQQRLFQKFSRTGQPTGGSGYKGTGLGLAICKQIVEAHQGKIWVESQEGGLTSFCFTLPQY